MDKGKLIVIEGACDGVGKSTQQLLLYNHLINDGEDVISHHFPSYGTPQGALIENYLKGNFGEVGHLPAYLINGLYAVDRGITWHTYLKSLYNQGKIILSDRYTTSSLIYQSALIQDIDKRKAFIDYVVDFEYNKLEIKSPDIVVFLYASFDLIEKMRKEREENEGVVSDIHENDLGYMRMVYENAVFVADYLSWDIVSCDDGNKMWCKEDIHHEVYSLVRRKALS